MLYSLCLKALVSLPDLRKNVNWLFWNQRQQTSVMAIAQEAILLSPVYVVSINRVCHPLVSRVISWLLRYMGDNGVILGRRFSSITCLSLAAVLLLFSSLGKCSAVACGLWWLVSCTIIVLKMCGNFTCQVRKRNYGIVCSFVPN